MTCTQVRQTNSRNLVMTHHNRPARNWCLTFCLRLKEFEDGTPDNTLLLADGSEDRVYEFVLSERGKEVVRYGGWQAEKGKGGSEEREGLYPKDYWLQNL